MEQRLQLRRGVDLELAVWGANSILSGYRHGRQLVGRPFARSGRTAAAPAPGGSSIAVFKGIDHLYEAAKFALSSGQHLDEALDDLNEQAQIYPATEAGLELPVLKEGVGSPVARRSTTWFAEASAVSPDFVWGPTMTQTYADVSDGFKAAASGAARSWTRWRRASSRHRRARGAVDPSRSSRFAERSEPRVPAHRPPRLGRAHRPDLRDDGA